ncbi:GntR family transcriptional regulator [Laceyella putida]|uniref:GntR family transcriptional regulator n=1 Tax=Laceyella putida TaxID=110101 RepID=A0ABW2RF73_9BACL
MAKVGLPTRSSDQVESKLIKAILEEEYSAGSALPPERELASSLGVGRPIVREVFQRLERDGWLAVRKGQPAIVNDYWRHGNLNTLANIIRNSERMTNEMIAHLLELRVSLTPAYVRDAVAAHHPKVVAQLAHLEQLADGAEAFATFDWQLQKSLAGLSPNPIYLLILNSFDHIYVKLASVYFSVSAHREASRQYYNDLLHVALTGDSLAAERLVREVMKSSLEQWRNQRSLANETEGGT